MGPLEWRAGERKQPRIQHSRINQGVPARLIGVSKTTDSRPLSPRRTPIDYGYLVGYAPAEAPNEPGSLAGKLILREGS